MDGSQTVRDLLIGILVHFVYYAFRVHRQIPHHGVVEGCCTHAGRNGFTRDMFLVTTSLSRSTAKRLDQ